MKPEFLQKRRESNYRVFKRWSRKSYAVFASMHKEIKISCINASYSLLSSFDGRFVPAFEGRINEFRMKSEDPNIPLPGELPWISPLVEQQKQTKCPKTELDFRKFIHSFLGISLRFFRQQPLLSSFPFDFGPDQRRRIPQLISAQILDPSDPFRRNW